jgi:regulator of sigma E protease
LFIILAILIFGVLIFTHELGHFLTAKLFGVRVNEFALCMGPAIWKKQIGETTYSLRCIPIGGYCAMEGEDEDSADPRAFTSAKPWKRAIILVAGAFMNFVTGLLILLAVYSATASFAVPRIDSFMDGAVIHSEDGLHVGDEFYKIDGERVYVYSDLDMLLSRNNTGVYDIVVKRDGELVELNDFTMKKQEFVQDGQTVQKYGIMFSIEEKTLPGVLRMGWNSALNFARLIRISIQDLISGAVGIKDMSGPVGIVSVIADTGSSSETAAEAALNVSYLAAFIAVNLAVMNLLPVPALDGGRIFALLITVILEKLLRRKIDPKYEGYIHMAGMILLLLFIAVITLKDIWTLIFG